MNDLQYLMYTLDRNGDGRLSYREFKRMIKHIAGHQSRNGKWWDNINF